MEPIKHIFNLELADGTEINNLEKYGDTFIANEIIDKSIFEYNTSPVKIVMKTIDGDDETIEEHSSMVCYPISDFSFALVDVSEIDIIHSRLESQVQYVAMMTDIDLEGV